MTEIPTVGVSEAELTGGVAMLNVRMSGFAIVVAVLSGLIGTATHGREVRPLTARELQDTTAGTLYYCAQKTGGFLPNTGCNQCKYFGVTDITWFNPLTGVWFTVEQAIWRNCDNNMGDDACYTYAFPFVAGSTPTCTKNLVWCGGTNLWFIGLGCTNPLPGNVANASGLSGYDCQTKRLQATSGTALGVNCSGEAHVVF